MTLNRSQQLQRQLITGSVAPWKTEQIGFEIAGRVDFVIEPNEPVQPRLDSAIALPPTAMATVDPERFQIAVKTAQADVAVAQRRFDANAIAIQQRLPAVISSAEADLELAETESDRAMRLAGQNAIPRAELDSTTTRLAVAKSSLAAAKAELAQANTEQLALNAQIARAQHSQSEAERNLRSTILHSSFRGIISAVHTVPGSYVQPGDPVVTVQMMDPMLVQFEVSAQDSRRYAKGDILNVLITNREGNRQTISGIVYTVDSVADPNSRTYTATLQVRNQQQSLSMSGGEADNFATTDNIYPLNLGPIITGDERQLVEKRCLHSIGEETYVWKITNRKWNQPSDTTDRTLTVEPVKVEPSQEIIPLLGKWNFVLVEFADGESIDLEHDLITSQLTLPPSVSDVRQWHERKVLLEQTDWMLRSGDVVQVSMTSANALRGMFVPMKAVLNESGITYLHVVEGAGSERPTVRRVAVEVLSQNLIAESSILLQVQSTQPGELQDGMQIVMGGTHYLENGDRIRIVENRGADK
jgi:multidrug efflux pump subunit AcrA (membrane-fusion protein)